MATSKCPHCKSTSFETKSIELWGSQNSIGFVQCASCGAPFGVVHYDLGPQLSYVRSALARMEMNLQQIASTLMDRICRLNR